MLLPAVIRYTTNNYGVATVPAGLSNVVAIAAGNFTVSWCVGRHGGRSGWPTGGQINVPATATNVIAVAAGDAHSLALRGAVIAWDTQQLRATECPEATNIVAAIASATHCLALRGDGRLVGWVRPCRPACAIQAPTSSPFPRGRIIASRSSRMGHTAGAGRFNADANTVPTIPSRSGSFLYIGSRWGCNGLFSWFVPFAGGAVQALYSNPSFRPRTRG